MSRLREWLVASGLEQYAGFFAEHRSDTRAALRDFFEVDRNHVTVAALKALADEGTIDAKIVRKAIEKYGIAADRPNPWDL